MHLGRRKSCEEGKQAVHFGIWQQVIRLPYLKLHEPHSASWIPRILNTQFLVFGSIWSGCNKKTRPEWEEWWRYENRQPVQKHSSDTLPWWSPMHHLVAYPPETISSISMRKLSFVEELSDAFHAWYNLLYYGDWSKSEKVFEAIPEVCVGM